MSARERQVLDLVAEGLSSKDIAARLAISTASVDTYRGRLMAKLGARNATTLVRMAIRAGLLQP